MSRPFLALLTLAALLRAVCARAAAPDVPSVGGVREVAAAAARGPAAEPPRYLDTAPLDRAMIGAAVEAVRGSRSARDVLRRVEASRRRPIRVFVRPLRGPLAQYDYLEDCIELDSRYRRGDPRQAGATLVHELVHVLQHGAGVPAEALEMELEAHLVTIDVLTQLGLGDRMDEFSVAARRKLAESPSAYVEWMARQMPSKNRLLGKGFDDVEEDLQDEVDSLDRRARRSKDPLIAQKLQWAQSDLALIESEEGRISYQAFARRVWSLIRRRHKALAGN